MREAKFRIWDKKEKKMYDKSQAFDYPELYLTLEGKIKEFCFAFGAGSEFEFEERKDNDLILIQYTGLKDKNNKEIYEGDILHWITVGKEGGNIEDVGIERDMGNYFVIFKEGKFVVTKPNIPIGHFDAEEIEVIGNIYENPELSKTYI